METISLTAAVQILQADNPAARYGDLMIYAENFLDYIYAQDNISQYGLIVAHPRSGTPIENPYLKIRRKAEGAMQNVHSVKKTVTLWQCACLERNQQDS